MQIRLHSSDPKRPARVVTLLGRTGMAVSILLLGAGTLVVLGLLGAPDLVAYVVRSAERLAVRETARKGVQAFESVVLRHDRLARRIEADELFLARIGVMTGVPVPDGILPPAASAAPPTPVDLELDVAHLARRLRLLERLRQKIAGTSVPAPEQLPSRSPVEPSTAVVVSTFGPRISPLIHRPEFHAGLLLAALPGTPVVAPGGGTVVFAGQVPARLGSPWRHLGKVVVLAHGEATRTLFGHLDKVLVRPRQKVARGEAIGRVGSSGGAEGAALEYGVYRRKGGLFVPDDPRLWILDAGWIGAEELRQRPEPPADLELPPPFR